MKSLMSISPLLGFVLLGASCTPALQIKAPDKPIVIELNVHIDQQVRVSLEKDVEDLIANNPGIF
ncbi:MAG: YnbE family lipoprotein [Robiginitomaculum sp.]